MPARRAACGQPLHQRLGLAQELLVGRGVRAALLDQVVEQLRHLLVEPRVGELVADDGLADVVDDPSAMAFFDSLPFSLSFLAMASWMPVSMISSVSDISPSSPRSSPDRPGCRC
jgi:hypothetical protein